MAKEKSLQSARERILKSAERLFIEKGYSNTTIRDVCREARTNVALINYYFTSKEELYKDLVISKTKPIIEQLKTLAEDREVPCREKFSRLFDIYTRFYETNYDLPRLLAREMVTNTEFTKWFHTNIVLRELRYIKQIFEDAQKDGVITDRYDPTILMIFCMGAMMFILAGHTVVDKIIKKELLFKGTVQEQIEIIKDLILNGIALK